MSFSIEIDSRFSEAVCSVIEESRGESGRTLIM